MAELSQYRIEFGQPPPVATLIASRREAGMAWLTPPTTADKPAGVVESVRSVIASLLSRPAFASAAATFAALLPRR